MTDLSKVLATKLADLPSVRLVPCTVVTVTPCTVSINGSDPVPGVTVAGLTYSTGHAVALWSPPALPLIIPIGV